MKKKILIFTMIFFIVITITGCNKKDNKEYDSNIKEQVVDYSGTFKSEDGSSIIITKDGDKYDANISLYRLTTFENCTVDNIKDGILTISGTDPNGNPIKFSFNWTTKTLTVVESTWDLLSENTKVDFNK